MERTFVILLLASFIGIALFGFSAASAMTGSGHVGCVADAFQALQGSTCPVPGNPLTLLASHLDSLRLFVGNAGAWLMLTLALAAFALIRFAGGGILPAVNILAPHRIAADTNHHALAKRIRWTALHESSPTRVSCCA